jgi:acyl-CoA dehydrogenase
MKIKGLNMSATIFLLLYLGLSLAVFYREMPSQIWDVSSCVYLFFAMFFFGFPLHLGPVFILLVAAVLTLKYMPVVTSAFESFIYERSLKAVPKLSKTEEEALSVGDTWLEADVFKGSPDWARLSSVKTELTEEESAFIQNEVSNLCQMVDDWKVMQALDFSNDIWDYMKEKGFFALVIDKAYGGKGFSARAHSDIVLKLASHSVALAVTVMVPNSLGPGELLQHYGTKEQKDHYLPRLASGQDIPCFALTEPGAGSDATSIQSEAIVFKDKGQKGLSLKINLNKRWITLSPVATLIGLAVNLKDPEGLLKGKGQEGITCVLIPRDTANLEIGNRHIPANQIFMNGTIRGEDIVVSIDTIIGGQEKAGHGWRMLVECLSIGRSISLPALGAASSSVAYLSASAFARLRRQFGVEIAQFEGIEEKLAEIGGLNYLVCATRLLTVAAVDAHQKPSVVSAITKYFNTEFGRIAVNHAMDIHAGRAVVAGPRNYLFNLYQSAPISITVEGANIMSRNLLIFGQGSMACHPFVKDEFYAIAKEDKAAFTSLLWQHIHYFVTNFAKTVTSAWTRGYFVDTPKNDLKRSYQKLTALSHAFAFMSDFALIILGGDLKRKERLSARLADGMSYLYLAMAALRLYEEKGADKDNGLHADWATRYCFHHAESALIGFCDNFTHKWLGYVVKFIAFPFGRRHAYPHDKLSHQLSRCMTKDNTYRQWLKTQLYLSGDSQKPLDKMEQALMMLWENAHLYKKVPDIRRVKFIDIADFCKEKVKEATLTQQEADALVKLEKTRWDALMVDEYAFEDVKKHKLNSLTDTLITPFDTK